MANIYDEWNKNTDLAGLQKDVKDAQSNKGDFEKVPYGNYEVKVDKMELKASKKGDPLVSIWFTIIEGKHKNSKIFLNQLILKGFQIHLMNEFLRSMDTGLDIEFVDYKQYANLILDVAEACDINKLEFALKYEDNKGYDKFTIMEVFEG